MRQEILQQTLWGEYFFHPKQKRILRSSNDGKLKPMFVQFVLQTLWHVYTSVLVTPDEVAPRARSTHAPPLLAASSHTCELPPGSPAARLPTQQLCYVLA